MKKVLNLCRKWMKMKMASLSFFSLFLRLMIVGTIVTPAADVLSQNNSCTQTTEPETITVVASKIVCDNEALLPNWGLGGSDITETTATDYITNNQGCSLVEGWKFQYGDKTAIKKAGDFYGEAKSAENWTTFGPTNQSGSVQITINIAGIATDPRQLRVREVLQEGYIPFAYSDNNNPVSAELYCSDDVMNYDNYDYIREPVAGQTYYCVGFNVETEHVHMKIEKHLVPSDDSGRFNLLVNGVEKVTDVGNNGITPSIKLDYGTYTISETGSSGTDLANYTTTYSANCTGGSMTVGANDHDPICIITNTRKDDAVCGNEKIEVGETCDDGNTTDGDGCSKTCQTETSDKGSISGCKYEDENGNGFVDSEDDKLPNWEIQLISCPYNPLDVDTLQFLPKSNINENPDSDQSGYCSVIKTVSTGEDGCYSFNDLENGYYGVSEVGKINWTQTYPENNTFYYFDLKSGEDEINIDFRNNFRIYQCSDNADNDGDESIDEEDPGCHTDGDSSNHDSYVQTDDDETNDLINSGDIVINEIMQNPDVVSDSVGEWIELYNSTNSDINVEGCIISDSGTNSHKIDTNGGSLIILANSYLVLAKNNDSSKNGGFTADYLYTGTTLSNADDEVILTCQSTEIDRVEYDGGSNFPNPTGKSMILSDPLLDNNLGVNWCESSSSFGDGDLGSPGNVNDSCAEGPSGIISGYKFNDLNGNDTWDVTDDEDDTNDEPGLSGWVVNLYKDTIDNFVVTTTTIATNLGYYEFKNLVAGTYFVKEVSQNGWQQTYPVNPDYYEITISDNEVSEDNNFGNYEVTLTTYQCSDGADNDDDGVIDAEDSTCHSDSDPTNSDSYLPEKDNEQNTPPVITLLNSSITINVGDGFTAKYHATANDAEDGDITPDIVFVSTVDTGSAGTYEVKYDVSDSEGESAPTKIMEVIVINQGCVINCGGGGSIIFSKPTIIITNEKVVYLGDGKAEVTWTTNIGTTQQVAYGDDSITTLGSLPTYGYDSVNDESNFMTKEHSMTIAGLTEQIPYFFRPIADRTGSTGEKVGIEVTYTLEEKGEVKGVEDSIIIPEEPCNYLLEYIKLGADNNPSEVMKLENFLNVFEGEKLTVNGIYEQVDFNAVSRFQVKYFEQVLAPWNHDSSTGYVYITTKRRINEIYCQKDFPLTSEQASEVALFSSRFANLATGLIELEANQDYSSTEEQRLIDTETTVELPEEEPGEVKGIDDVEGSSGVAGENDGITEEIIAENQDDILLIAEDNQEGDETSEDNSIIQSAGGFNFWVWFLVLIIIGIVVYFLLSSSKNKNKNEI